MHELQAIMLLMIGVAAGFGLGVIWTSLYRNFVREFFRKQEGLDFDKYKELEVE